MKWNDVFLHYSDIKISILGLGLFLFVFVGSVIWTSLKVNRQKYEFLAVHLLKDGEDL